jgi:hypothetical protein
VKLATAVAFHFLQFSSFIYSLRNIISEAETLSLDNMRKYILPSNQCMKYTHKSPFLNNLARIFVITYEGSWLTSKK